MSLTVRSHILLHLPTVATGLASGTLFYFRHSVFFKINVAYAIFTPKNRRVLLKFYKL